MRSGRSTQGDGKGGNSARRDELTTARARAAGGIEVNSLTEPLDKVQPSPVAVTRPSNQLGPGHPSRTRWIMPASGTAFLFNIIKRLRPRNNERPDCLCVACAQRILERWHSKRRQCTAQYDTVPLSMDLGWDVSQVSE
jgi:hypothetical protein